jgi:hypothetical protein
VFDRHGKHWHLLVPPMHEVLWQLACDENGIDATEDFHFLLITRRLIG